jgi:site-specific recombinase XerD
MKQQSQEPTGDTREYSELSKRTKREIRKDLQKYKVNLTQNILENSRSIKRIRKELGIGKYWMLGAKDEKGRATQSRYRIVRAATNFYRQLYDNKSQLNPNNPQKKEEEEVPPIINREIEDAIMHLRNNRTPKDNSLIDECLKWGKEKLTTTITTLFNRIIKSEEIPQQW